MEDYKTRTERFERMVTEAAKEIWRLQCENPWRGVWLHYVPSSGATWGRLIAASEDESPGEIVHPERLPSHLTVDGMRALIYPWARRLPLLPTQ